MDSEDDLLFDEVSAPMLLQVCSSKARGLLVESYWKAKEVSD